MSPEESSENDEVLSKSDLQAKITGIEVVQFILARNNKTLWRNTTEVLKTQKRMWEEAIYSPKSMVDVIKMDVK